LLYSVPLTLIVLVSLPLYVGLSLMVVPVLRKRLDEKFARGAENQALLVEAISGMQTVKAGALEPSQVKLTRSGNNLVVGITGSTDTLTVTNWYASAANKVEQILLADGSVITLGTAAPLSVASPIARQVLQVRRLLDPLAVQSVMAGTSFLDGDRSAQLLVQAMAQFHGGSAAGDAVAPPHWRHELMRGDLATPM
jgi:Haemolysin-type calcium binding protein related domain/ABC transporter transmembrane region